MQQRHYKQLRLPAAHKIKLCRIRWGVLRISEIFLRKNTTNKQTNKQTKTLCVGGEELALTTAYDWSSPTKHKLPTRSIIMLLDWFIHNGNCQLKQDGVLTHQYKQNKERREDKCSEGCGNSSGRALLCNTEHMLGKKRRSIKPLHTVRSQRVPNSFSSHTWTRLITRTRSRVALAVYGERVHRT